MVMVNTGKVVRLVLPGSTTVLTLWREVTSIYVSGNRWNFPRVTFRMRNAGGRLTVHCDIWLRLERSEGQREPSRAGSRDGRATAKGVGISYSALAGERLGEKKSGVAGVAGNAVDLGPVDFEAFYELEHFFEADGFEEV